MKRDRHTIIQSRMAASLAAALGGAMAFMHMAFAATPWTHLNYQNNPDDFQFAIVPDRTGGDYRSAFTNALDKVNRMHPEFVITVGDLVEGTPDIMSFIGSS